MKNYKHKNHFGKIKLSYLVINDKLSKKKLKKICVQNILSTHNNRSNIFFIVLP